MQHKLDMSHPRPKQALYVRVLVIPQGDDQWLAQGLDYDLASQGPSGRQAVQSFVRILMARVKRDYQNGKAPLENLPQAPDRFFEMWDRLERQQDSLTVQPASDPTGDIPPAYVIQHIAANNPDTGMKH